MQAYAETDESFLAYKQPLMCETNYSVWNVDSINLLTDVILYDGSNKNKKAFVIIIICPVF